MNNELLLLVKKLTDTMIEQTKTKPQETLEEKRNDRKHFKMNKQNETFSISPPINLFEEGKWLLAVNSFEAMSSVLIITDGNNTLSITIRGHWQTKSAKKNY